MRFRAAARWILKNTVVTNESLTPGYQLRLITQCHPLWMSTPDKCPFPDPYWAFYWPGGQAMTRFIVDNPCMFNDATVLDFGSGCGSISIAASDSGARSVISNDIDTYALLATRINYRLNGVCDRNVVYSAVNYLHIANEQSLLEHLKKSPNSFILLGDMFYDSEFAQLLLLWIKRIKSKSCVRVLVGDPDRHPLVEKKYLDSYSVRFTKEQLAEYPLPGYVIKEHYGFNTAKVFEIVV